MYAEVILHRRVPGRFESFTYSVPEGLAVCEGQMVTVPFRKQKLAAVVRRLSSHTPAFAVRPIESAHADFLPQWQMELAQWMAAKYGSSLANALRMMMPQKEKGKEKMVNMHGKMEHGDEKREKKIAQWAEKILTEKKTVFILEKAPLPKREFFRACAQTIPNDGQVLFLFPEIFGAAALGAGFPLFHSEISEKQKNALWHAAANGSLHTLAGTRAALFLPFKNLKLIVLSMEESQSYHEQRQPAYHTPEVAEEMARLLKIPLVILSGAPRAETWHQVTNGMYEKMVWEDGASGTQTTVLDMKDERLKGNFGTFAEKTVEAAAAALGRGKQVLLFVNRKGEGGALFCRDCKEVARCSTCHQPLSVHRGMMLRCHRCRTECTAPAACHACQGARLVTLGTGTEKLEDEIKKIFGAAVVMRLDRESAGKKRGMLDEKKLQAADIIVATQMIEKPIVLPRLALAVAISADSLLMGQDFRGSERAWQLLTHIKNLTQEDFIIQTLLPEHRFFTLFSQNKMEEFYEEELATRKSLSLPPYSS